MCAVDVLVCREIGRQESAPFARLNSFPSGTIIPEYPLKLPPPNPMIDNSLNNMYIKP